MTEPTNDRHVPRILVIDNDDDLARVVATRLEHNGYRCVTAGSGAQGLSIFADGGIDLVITDLNMPGGDGISVVESVRAQCVSTPVLVMTGFTEAFRDRLRALPHVSCIRKPFDSEALIDLVETELTLAEVDS